jgi:hypothetical protein
MPTHEERPGLAIMVVVAAAAGLAVLAIVTLLLWAAGLL